MAPAWLEPAPASGMWLQDSIKKFERELMLERHVTLMEEKQVILKRQQEEVSQLMHRQVGDGCMQVGREEDGRGAGNVWLWGPCGELLALGEVSFFPRLITAWLHSLCFGVSKPP